MSGSGKYTVDLDFETTLNRKIVSRDDCKQELEQAQKDLNLQDAEVDSSRSDKEAKEFVETHAVVSNSRFEMTSSFKDRC